MEEAGKRKEMLSGECRVRRGGQSQGWVGGGHWEGSPAPSAIPAPWHQHWEGHRGCATLPQQLGTGPGPPPALRTTEIREKPMNEGCDGQQGGESKRHNKESARVCQDLCPEPWAVAETLPELQELQIPRVPGRIPLSGSLSPCTSPSPFPPPPNPILQSSVHTLEHPQRFARGRLCHEPSAAKISMKMVVFHKRKICGCP